MTPGKCYCGHAARNHIDKHALCLVKGCFCLIFVSNQPVAVESAKPNLGDALDALSTDKSLMVSIDFSESGEQPQKEQGL